MRRHIPLAMAALAAMAILVAPAVTSAGAATSSAMPQHVYAPYFETWDSADGGLAQLSAASGAKYLSLAFLETDQSGSCAAYWNGDTSMPIAAASFGTDIAAIQASGGNVVPSFGGYTADTTNTELADSCTDVDAIAKVYESLISTYHVARIDLDIEASSLSDTAGIARRNQAIAQTKSWAAAHGLPIQFSYTIPTFPTGLTPAGLYVLQDAVAEHAVISVVNIMTFDYWIGTTQDMLADAESAASGVYGQLTSLYPTMTPRARWGMIGVTQMPGIDDFGPAETFRTDQAAAFLHWAVSKGIGMISMWALQRDNGGCPGTQGAGSCSGVAQPDWYFSHTFEPFSHLPAAA